MLSDHFRKFAQKTSSIAGSPQAFGLSVLVIVVWACLGPLFHYTDTWQLIINTGTTIVTFLMVFLIQNSQNRDAKSLHLKVDELIHANKHARNQLMDLDRLTDHELDKIHDELLELNKSTEEKINKVRKKRPLLGKPVS